MTRILIVDDEETIRLALRKFLRSRGYEVEIAGSGEQALQILARQSFSLMLCDVRMPGRDGFELLEWLRSQKKLRHIGMVMLTEACWEYTRVMARKKGALACVDKQVLATNPTRLLKAVAQYVAEVPKS